MAARMRELFLRELMTLHQVIKNSEQEEKANSEPSSTEVIPIKEIITGTPEESHKLERQQQQHPSQSQQHQKQNYQQKKNIDITFLSDCNKTAGQTLTASFIACDTQLKHLIISDLGTPIGMQSSALLRLDDVVSITYR